MTVPRRFPFGAGSGASTRRPACSRKSSSHRPVPKPVGFVPPMNLSLRHVRRVIREVPEHGKLAYCLLRDPRVPAAPKVALLAAVGVIVSPLDLPAWLPVIGELDVLALGVLAVKTFVEACPEEVVAENRAALRTGTSIWDTDRTMAVERVRAGLLRWMQKGRLRLKERQSRAG